jgi:hypothetical protein
MRTSFSGTWWFPLLSLFVLGCGSDDKRLPVHPARGQILYAGKSIPHAQITFHPLDTSKKDAPRPHATVAKDGTFALTTYNGDDGAPAGEYAVTVEWWLTDAKRGTQEGDSAPPTNRLPKRYASVSTSKLHVTIQEGDNELPIIQLPR